MLVQSWCKFGATLYATILTIFTISNGVLKPPRDNRMPPLIEFTKEPPPRRWFFALGAISVLLEDNGRRQHTRSPQSVLIGPGRTARDPGRGTLPCEAFVGIVDVAEAVAAGDVGGDGQLMLARGDHADIGQIGRVGDDGPLLAVQLHRVDGGGVVRHLHQC